MNLRTCLLALALLAPLPTAAGRPDVAPAAVAELSRRADAPLILDVRSREEYAAGHVPGAINIPHAELAERLPELGEPAWVLVYCRSGRRADIAERVLAGAGIESRQLEGHFPRWQAEGRPVARPGAEAAR
ncbi:rhodanese-like domain-containing protein [Arenimonas fontis]|nr:rhodanese-like domain-containing protein [Arenimonas fontis]